MVIKQVPLKAVAISAQPPVARSMEDLELRLVTTEVEVVGDMDNNSNNRLILKALLLDNMEVLPTRVVGMIRDLPRDSMDSRALLIPVMARDHPKDRLADGDKVHHRDSIRLNNHLMVDTQARGMMDGINLIVAPFSESVVVEVACKAL